MCACVCSNELSECIIVHAFSFVSDILACCAVGQLISCY